MKMSMRKFICRFLKSRSGVTAIEYGLIASLIAVTIVGAVSRIGTTELSSTFAKINAAF
jgi:pilus assembly protein Flp/PilA